jgi:hypothetical protein
VKHVFRCLGFVAFLATLACSAPPTDARFVAKPPDATSFALVAPALVHSCGTLDCHGKVARSFRIYGATGLRLNPNDRPSATSTTTPDEIAQTYASLVGLEPEILSSVVAAGGANPERLTFVRKARGSEGHKGGSVVKIGDDEDVCITSWLSGHADNGACSRALSLP